MIFNFQEHVRSILDLSNYQSDNCYKFITKNDNRLLKVLNKNYNFNLSSIDEYFVADKLLCDLKYSNKIATPQLILILLLLVFAWDLTIIIKNNNIYCINIRDYSDIKIINLLDTNDDIIVIPYGNSNLTPRDIIKSITKDKLSDYEYNHYRLDRSKIRAFNMFKNDILYIIYYRHLLNTFDDTSINTSILSNYLIKPYTNPFMYPNNILIHQQHNNLITHHNTDIFIDKEDFTKSIQSMPEIN